MIVFLLLYSPSSLHRSREKQQMMKEKKWIAIFSRLALSVNAYALPPLPKGEALAER